MNYTLFDSETRNQLLPFTHTRPVADIRCGIMTMRERWELLLRQPTASLCPNYMQDVFPKGNSESSTFIDASIFANKEIVAAIEALNDNEQLVYNTWVIAAKTSHSSNINYEHFAESIKDFKLVPYHQEPQKLNHIWDIFLKNESAIKADFLLMTKGKKSQTIPEYVTAISPENIFIEEGAVLNPCIINAAKGPIYIAAHAEIMEGCMLRGPIALGKHAVLKMGAKVYGATTIGAGCKVGGEVSNVVFFANSNKGHDGFMGNAVIGEWCNLGADTNCSNLKNNYDIIKVWSEYDNKLVNTGLQFCGLMMGDHSKSGINTMFNTGTVVGVSSNVFGSNFPEKFVPSFSWGAASEITSYQFDKAIETASRMMERRGMSLSEAEQKMYRYLFDNRA